MKRILTSLLEKLKGPRDPKHDLLEKIQEQGFHAPDWRHNDPLPIVTVEEFFAGNEDKYSIACNLDPHPALSHFRDHLLVIEQRSDVSALWLEITEIEEALTSPEVWPYCERVYVVTAASQETAEGWNATLHANGPIEGFAFDVPRRAGDIPAGFSVWQFVWD